MTYTPRDHVNQSGQLLLGFAAAYKRRTAVIAGMIESGLNEMAFGQVRELANWRREQMAAITEELIGHEQGLVKHIEGEDAQATR